MTNFEGLQSNLQKNLLTVGALIGILVKSYGELSELVEGARLEIV